MKLFTNGVWRGSEFLVPPLKAAIDALNFQSAATGRSAKRILYSGIFKMRRIVH